MYRNYCSYDKYCRWCGKAYKAKAPIGKDGFHSNACKMAHHRAYKKYVTAKRPAGRQTRPGPRHAK